MLLSFRHLQTAFLVAVLGAIAVLGIGGVIAVLETLAVMWRLGTKHPGIRLDTEPQLTETSEQLASYYSVLLVLCLILWVAVWTTPATFAFLISISTFAVFLLTQLNIKARLVPAIKRYLFDQKPVPVEPEPEPEPKLELELKLEFEPEPQPKPKSKFHHSQPRDCANRRNANLPRLRR